ncbi:actin-binding LIM protein 1 isoform X3 [Coccinella septempunctata]|uniref:actin-binding LIM protein 1 isoform X3 n=1 Tax=Coccinella septempunctata TaxID=41139 RepID=UPI001D081231|nr:actin-binding LIM protein 1 isoform X3 [Coccinella septempunctata]
MKTKNKLDDGKTTTQQLIISEQQNNNNGLTAKPPAPVDKKKLEKLEKEKEKERKKAEKNLKKGKTLCQACKKKCSGEVLRVQDKYFHTQCFKCKVCGNSLAQGGFFSKDGFYYCTADYQRHFGTKCASCQDYVEGEVVTALGKTYHQKCFTCDRCRQPFPSGDKVTYTGKEVLCQKCVHIPIRDGTPSVSPTTNNPNECAGCQKELKEGQALVALERQWHIWCFKCGVCDAVLHGEYMGRDGIPYCERDYQKQYGVKCAYCNRYISGKVLQAGDNHHFHPTCARCTKCGDPFGDGEEMYLQGGAIWHPRCGPGPTENGQVLNGSGHENGHLTDTDISVRDYDSSAVSEMQFSMHSRTPSLNGSLCSPTSMSRKHFSYRTSSPGLILRDDRRSANYHDAVSRIHTISYLTEEPTLGYLKKPIDPYDKVPTSPHFHRPSSQNSLRSSIGAGGKRSSSRSAMKAMVDSMRSETPRPKSPHMNNEEPIELSHYPAAHPPKPGEQAKIERDDFPAPPYPYTDPERRKRWSGSYKGVQDSDEDEVDAVNSKEAIDPKLKKEEEELSKIASGMGKVFLKEVQEREKIKLYKAAHLDPRNASRTPSANKEPTYRLRYENPIGASPSRNMDHHKLYEDDDFDRSYSGRSSTGGRSSTNYNVVSALRHVPKPGYGLAPRSHTFSSSAGSYPQIPGDYSFSGMGMKTHSTDSCGKSDISTGSITDVERRVMNTESPAYGRYPGRCGYQVRRSLPNMAHSMLINEPAKIYPYHLLVITNYRLPSDVDRCNLERHLSDAEFEALFQLSRTDFYRLPQWRRNELKRRARLF